MSELPAGFEDLGAWTEWSLATMDERRDKRASSSMDEIDAFYDAMLPRLEAVLEYLSTLDLQSLEGPNETLMNMALTLAEMAPAVEQFFEPTISYGYDVTRFSQGQR